MPSHPFNPRRASEEGTSVACHGLDSTVRNLLDGPERANVVFQVPAHGHFLPLGALHASRFELDDAALHNSLDGLVIGALTVEGRPVDVDQPLAVQLTEQPYLAADVLAKTWVGRYVEERVLLDGDVLDPSSQARPLGPRTLLTEQESSDRDLSAGSISGQPAASSPAAREDRSSPRLRPHRHRTSGGAARRRAPNHCGYRPDATIARCDPRKIPTSSGDTSIKRSGESAIAPPQGQDSAQTFDQAVERSRVLTNLPDIRADVLERDASEVVGRRALVDELLGRCRLPSRSGAPAGPRGPRSRDAECARGWPSCFRRPLSRWWPPRRTGGALATRSRCGRSARRRQTCSIHPDS